MLQGFWLVTYKLCEVEALVAPLDPPVLLAHARRIAGLAHSRAEHADDCLAVASMTFLSEAEQPHPRCVGAYDPYPHSECRCSVSCPGNLPDKGPGSGETPMSVVITGFYNGGKTRRARGRIFMT